MTTAGFRFIPIAPQVVEPPTRFTDLDLSRPAADVSVSGSLDITWTAETPICIGDGKDPVMPIRLGGAYALPGASLRGMVRAVTEIATFSHLGHINAARHYGVRDYNFARMPDAHKHRLVRTRPQHDGSEPEHYLRAGWLKFDGKHWALSPCLSLRRGYDEGFWLVHFQQLLDEMSRRGHSAPSINQWRTLDLPAKYRELQNARLQAQVTPIDDGPYLADRSPEGVRCARFDLPPSYEERSRQSVSVLTQQEKARLRPSGDLITGYIVCAGPSVDADDPQRVKIWETIFANARSARQPLSKSFMTLFHALHSDPGRNKRDPRGSWRFWLAAKDWLGAFDAQRRPEDPNSGDYRGYPGIPVFYHGDPAKVADAAGEPMATRDFFIGLTRVLRLPWPYSVGDVTQRLYTGSDAAARPAYLVPRLGAKGGWDFARALFGEVDDAHLDGEAAKARREKEGAPKALAGRVAFGPAFAQGDRRPSIRKQGVFGTPRESYYPFYLARAADAGESGTQRYDDPGAIPAGRKRYVVRQTADPQLPQGNQNEKTMTSVHFLPDGTRFTGRVRFHNLHPVELGALLWALTFGEPGGSYRHQIGRAKAQGYGVLRADIAWRPPSPRIVGQIGGDPKSFETYLGLFRDYMKSRLGGEYEQTEQIVLLLRYADPATGEANIARLATLPLEGAGGYAQLKRAFSQHRQPGSGPILQKIEPPG